MPKIEANGIQVYYELHGPADRDVLVLSNGVLMSTASWAFNTLILGFLAKQAPARELIESRIQ